jgi:ribosomal protein L16 Arg81 hydroxylase
MAAGLGFVVRGAERNDPALAELAAAFALDLPGKINVQLFATRAGTNGFGWHYDFEEVFIVQTAGVKDYYFRDNTVDRDTTFGTQPDFERFRQEKSPLATARLLPGDWLYLPARWWHMARCLEDSLSISVGVLPR